MTRAEGSTFKVGFFLPSSTLGTFIYLLAVRSIFEGRFSFNSNPLICTQHGIRNVFCGQAPSQISAVVNIENPMLTMTMTVRAVTGNNARHDNLTLKTKHQSRATLLKDKVVPPGKRSQTYQ